MGTAVVVFLTLALVTVLPSLACDEDALADALAAQKSGSKVKMQVQVQGLQYIKVLLLGPK